HILSVPLPSIERTTYTSYDALGRMISVRESGGQNSGSTLELLSYGYDPLGNVRSIYSQYTPSGGSSTSSDTWFTYDAEGRMTIADGILDGNVIKAGNTGTKITYDALGRRATTERRDGSGSCTIPGDGVTTHWKEYRLESLEYDDLSHLK